MAVIVDIAEAVTDALNAGTFSRSFTARRHYLPVFELKDMDTLHVSVVPKETTIEPADRTREKRDVAVDIGVQQRLPASEKEADELDALMTLVDELADHLRFGTLELEHPPGAGAKAVWIRTENAPVYAPEHIDQLRQFTSVLTVTYRIMR